MSEALLRESPWGPVEVVDAHVHFLSHRFFTVLESQGPGLSPEEACQRIGWQAPPAEPERLAEIWARELDRNSVRASALIASVPGEEASVAMAVRAFPERFFVYAMADPRYWNPLTFSDVRVACLFPAMHRFSMHDECVEQVFAWAEENHRGVFVHCGVLSVGVRGKLGLASPFDMRYSNPIDLHEVALRHPEVPVIIPHFGAGYFREALMVADLCPNVYLDTSSSNSWTRYQDSHLDLRQVFRRALDVVGPKRLLFGTDSSFFPRGWQQAIFEQQAKALYEIDLSAANARAIFGQNLLRILGR